MQSRSMMSSAKPTNATLFGSRRDVSALKKVPSPSATKKAQRQRFLQPIDAAAGKEFRAWDDAKNSKKRTDLKKIMIIGAGPIVIGQVIRIYLHRIHILRSLPRSSWLVYYAMILNLFKFSSVQSSNTWTRFFSAGGVFSHRLEMRARSRERCASFKRDIIASRDEKMILTYSTLFYHPNRRASLITPGRKHVRRFERKGTMLF